MCALAAQAAALSVQGDGPDLEAPLARAARGGVFSRRQFRAGQCDADEFLGRALETLGENAYQTFAGRSAVQQHIFGIFIRNRTFCRKCTFVQDAGEIKNSFYVEMQQLCERQEDQVDLQVLLQRQIRLHDSFDDACPSQSHLRVAERDAQGVCRGGTTAKFTFWDRLPPVAEKLFPFVFVFTHLNNSRSYYLNQFILLLVHSSRNIL